MNGIDSGDIIRSFWDLERSSPADVPPVAEARVDSDTKALPQSSSKSKGHIEASVRELISGSVELLGTSEPGGIKREDNSAIKAEENVKGARSGMTIDMSMHKFMPLTFGTLVGLWR